MANLVFSLWLVSIGRDDLETCPDCGFDSLETHRFGILTASGVNGIAKTYCPRCV